MSREKTSVELFAGGGGLALGLEQAGFKHILLVEKDSRAVETLRHNRPEWNVVKQDVFKADFIKLTEPYRKGTIDLLAGGAPCQSFSYAGKGLGFADIRGTLFAEFARCLEEIKPRAFIFENVKGMLRHDQGKTFKTIVETFEDKGYNVYHKVLNASYYGVGQARERLIVVGFNKDIASDLEYHFPEPDETQTTLRQALLNVPESEGAQYSETKKHVLSLVPEGGWWKDLPDGLREEYGGKFAKQGGTAGMARRLAWDKPSLTIMTTPSQKMTERCHPNETRPLTVRESARVQSFPDEWEFCGSMSAKYRQIGNAVPVELARRIGLSVLEHLDKISE